MRKGVFALLAVAMMLPALVAAQAFAATACGEPAPAPKFQVGEKWTWRDATGNERTDEVIQVEGDTYQIRWGTGDVAFFDKDRILRKVHKKNGEVVTTQGAGAYVSVGKNTLDFPLQVGKKWDFDFVTAPDHNRGSLQTYIQSYEVVACEDVTTAVGKLSAFKIEVNQRVASGGSGGTYYFWFAPDVKASVRRQYIPSNWWGKTYDTELVKYEHR